VQAIFKKVHTNGWLQEVTVQQLFSVGLNKFLADRFVEGTCPKPNCGYTHARGDQCDSCGALLNPAELLEPRCKFTGGTPCCEAQDTSSSTCRHSRVSYACTLTTP